MSTKACGFLAITLALPVAALAQPGGPQAKSIVEVVGDLKTDVENLKHQQPGAAQPSFPSIRNIEFVNGLAKFKNAGGSTVVDIGEYNGGGLWIYDDRQNVAVSALGGSGHGILTLSDKGKVRTRIEQNDGGGIARFYGGNAKDEVVAIGAGNQGPGALWIYNTDYKNVAFIGSSTTGQGLLELSDLHGQSLALLGMGDPGKGGMLSIYGAQGKKTAAFGTGGSGGGSAWFYDADGNRLAEIGSSGDDKLGYFWTKGNDYAEVFDAADATGLVPGSVVSASADGRGIVLSDGPYDPKVVGVLSGAGGLAPGVTIGGSGGQGAPTVAMAGQVFVRVSAEGGAIVPGDLLVASSTPGVAMRASDRARAFGAVVGKALEPWPGTGEGSVRMLVMNH
ncbi:MAG TPA: hypothetical protein VKX45_14705 [Bryobacteraceae bacterium]|nr:hypothetical protein [Bryobacteraceae bacterium]